MYNFVEKVLVPRGFELIRWTRLTYLCEGDIQQAFYWLDDVIFVVKAKEWEGAGCSGEGFEGAKVENTCPKPD